eukprot:m.9086 g.9086  ORF g.9086 m.9086 type:complete len:202 (+) comp21078_c0_seq1:51-656(+)
MRRRLLLLISFLSATHQSPAAKSGTVSVTHRRPAAAAEHGTLNNRGVHVNSTARWNSTIKKTVPLLPCERALTEPQIQSPSPTPLKPKPSFTLFGDRPLSSPGLQQECRIHEYRLRVPFGRCQHNIQTQMCSGNCRGETFMSEFVSLRRSLYRLRLRSSSNCNCCKFGDRLKDKLHTLTCRGKSIDVVVPVYANCMCRRGC